MSNEIKNKVVIGVFGFSGCAGDQLRIIHMEDELLDLFTKTDIKFFYMAQSKQEVDKLDIALVEGSINTTKQIEELKEIREKSKYLVAIGTCACFGGIQYINKENRTLLQQRFEEVYGTEVKKSEFIVGEVIPPQPLCNFVKVDEMIPGCPIEKSNFLPIILKLINDIKPQLYPYSVCLECKLKDNECLLLKGLPCLGPVTSGGCNAICPEHNLPCVGCWGPYEAANYVSMIDKLVEIGLKREDAIRKIELFGGQKAEECITKVTKND